MVAALPRALPSLMLFSICWSLGASCDKAGRGLVDKLIRSRVSELGQSQQVLQQLPADGVMPDSATVYDWCYDHKVRHLGKRAGLSGIGMTNVIQLHSHEGLSGKIHVFLHHCWVKSAKFPCIL
jgi:hypothetical protein